MALREITDTERAELSRYNELLARVLAPEFERYMRRMAGEARQAIWTCEDGWLAGYTTTRVEGGPHHGKWLAMSYKPVGKGARGGRAKAESWERNYVRGFATRRAARARAEAIYWRHSPKRAAKHGR